TTSSFCRWNVSKAPSENLDGDNDALSLASSLWISFTLFGFDLRLFIYTPLSARCASKFLSYADDFLLLGVTLVAPVDSVCRLRAFVEDGVDDITAMGCGA